MTEFYSILYEKNGEKYCDTFSTDYKQSVKYGENLGVEFKVVPSTKAIEYGPYTMRMVNGDGKVFKEYSKETVGILMTIEEGKKNGIPEEVILAELRRILDMVDDLNSIKPQ